MLFYFDKTAIPQITVEQVKNNPILMPSLAEQRRIAEFLDKKTGEIDALVGKKESLLKLLAEKRAALITHAVTKGINPKAPMKASGIDWIGAIPSSWKVMRLKYLASYNDDVLPEKIDFELTIRYIDISSVDLIDGITKYEELEFSAAPSRARRIVRDGDTILSTVRTYLKAVALVKNPMKNTIASTGFIVIRPKQKAMIPDYVGYMIQSEGFIQQVTSQSVGVSYPAINAVDVVNIPILAPEIKEQKAIAEFLDKETAKIDVAQAKVKEAIARLKEYRAALITNAVTGKIKVV